VIRALRRAHAAKSAVRPRPLAAGTFLLRNAGRTLPLIGVIMLAVLLIAGIVSMMNSIPLSIRTIYSYSQNLLAISPRGDPDVTQKIVERVQAGSPVEIDRIAVCRASGAQVRSIVGKWRFVVLGLEQKDMRYYLERLGVQRVDGRLPEPGAPEALISQPVARNLNLELGDVLLGPDQQDNYSPQEVRVVGIARTDQWLMVNDIDYQRAKHFPPIDNVLVFAKNLDDQQALDAWAEEEFKTERAQVFTFSMLERETREMFSILYRILDVVIATLVLVITIMMGMLINIYQSQRLVEFGLLQALGYTKRQLIGRVLKESALVVTFGWLMGIGFAYLMLLIVKRTLMDPNAFYIATADLVALQYTVPIPAAIMIVAAATVILRFRRFDPVGVVERRLL
jgi:ABC-type lipoprotein release transport system permease subunit